MADEKNQVEEAEAPAPDKVELVPVAKPLDHRRDDALVIIAPQARNVLFVSH